MCIHVYIQHVHVCVLLCVQYFELYLMFEALDSGDDRRLSELELKTAAPLLQRWGLTDEESGEAFASMDYNGSLLACCTVRFSTQESLPFSSDSMRELCYIVL